jgi:hypothetical protein
MVQQEYDVLRVPAKSRKHMGGGAMQATDLSIVFTSFDLSTSIALSSHSRIPNLTMAMLCGSEARNPTVFPELHGMGIKAAHMKHLVKPVLNLCRRFNRNEPKQKHRFYS